MSSLLPGYEYDIFISYRQNDNRSGWVTEFVEALQEELAATIKEPLSVYFDSNPHDGLLETHNVDKSLEGKLKCLIFIPIISQTYCDPKSFAWKHEFCAFNKWASEESLGRHIKLKNGNVADRILPIKIHDVDEEDKAIIEQELGGTLRSIEFIYKEPGVNRPLKATDSKEDNNLGTDYRNQLNKVANAIKDLVRSFKKTESDDSPKQIFKQRGRKTPVLRLTIAILLLAFAGYWILKFFPSADANEKEQIAIAVLPFKLIAEKNEGQYIADGLMDVVLTNLSILPELKVKSSTSVERYRNSEKTVAEIAEELKVDYVLEGSAQKYGNDIRVILKLVDVTTESPIWSKEVTRKYENIFELQSEISREIANELEAKLTPQQLSRISKPPTSSVEAYDLYLQAKDATLNDTADPKKVSRMIELLRKAIRIDTGFAMAYTDLGWAMAMQSVFMSNLGKSDSSQFYLEKAIAIDSLSSHALSMLIAHHLYMRRGDRDDKFETVRALLERAIRLNPTDPSLYEQLGTIYGDWRDHVIALKHFHKALSMDPDREVFIDVMQGMLTTYLAIGDTARFFQLSRILTTLKAPPTIYLIYAYNAAKDYDKSLQLVSQLQASQHAINKALIYYQIPQFDKAIEHFEQYFDLPDEKRTRGMDYHRIRYAHALKKQQLTKRYLEETRKVDEFLARGGLVVYPTMMIARLHALKGENEKAIQVLQGSRFVWHFLQRVEDDPSFSEIRNDPRFTERIRYANDSLAQIRNRVKKMEEDGVLPDLDEVLSKLTVSL